MKFLDAMWRCFAGPPASEFLDDIRAANFNRVAAELRDALESLEDMKAEAHRHSEAAAAARLRNADLQRRLDAALQALDKARADLTYAEAVRDELKRDMDEDKRKGEATC